MKNKSILSLALLLLLVGCGKKTDTGPDSSGATTVTANVPVPEKTSDSPASEPAVDEKTAQGTEVESESKELLEDKKSISEEEFLKLSKNSYSREAEVGQLSETSCLYKTTLEKDNVCEISFLEKNVVLEKETEKNAEKTYLEVVINKFSETCSDQQKADFVSFKEKETGFKSSKNDSGLTQLRGIEQEQGDDNDSGTKEDEKYWLGKIGNEVYAQVTGLKFNSMGLEDGVMSINVTPGQEGKAFFTALIPVQGYSLECNQNVYSTIDIKTLNLSDLEK